VHVKLAATAVGHSRYLEAEEVLNECSLPSDVVLRQPPSRPRELHPSLSQVPCLSLSTHTARATPEGCRLPSEPSSSSGCPLTLTIPMRVTCSLPSTAITPLHRYYETVRPCRAHRYFDLTVHPLVPFPFTSPTRFSSSVQKARIRVVSQIVSEG